MQHRLTLPFTSIFLIPFLPSIIEVLSASEGPPVSGCRWQLQMAVGRDSGAPLQSSSTLADVDLELVPLRQVEQVTPVHRRHLSNEVLDAESSGPEQRRSAAPERVPCWRLRTRIDTRLGLVVDNTDFNFIVSGKRVHSLSLSLTCGH